MHRGRQQFRRLRDRSMDWFFRLRWCNWRRDTGGRDHLNRNSDRIDWMRRNKGRIDRNNVNSGVSDCK